MPEVSVIIPFFNQVDWTVEAVQSALNQSFQDFEIILVDDGSNEDLQPLMALQDERIQYVRQLHQGPSAARNHGLDLAEGEYIAFLDSDDLWVQDKLKIQVGCMDSNPQAALSHTSYKRMDINGNDLEIMSSGAFSGWVYPNIFLNCPIATPTVMLRRKSIGDLRFEEKIIISEDILFWSKIAKTSEIIGIDRPLARVRIHGFNSALNLHAQITGYNNIIKYAIKKEEGFLLNRAGRELLALMLINQSRYHLTLGMYGKGLLLYIQAFITAPDSLKVWRGLAGSIRAVLCHIYWVIHDLLSMLAKCLLPEKVFKFLQGRIGRPDKD